MNSYRLQISALALLAMIAPSTSASAAQMGPLSRDSVSISVTVPPHVIVTQAARFDASSAAPTLCVGTNGFSQYHLAMIRHSVAAEDEEMLGEGEGRSDGSICPGAFPVMPHMLAGREPSSPGAVTLLIIPD